jgi:predicted nucleic acid-binding protein
VKLVWDTSVVLSPRAPAVTGEVAISAATIAELHFGVLVATDPAVRAERLRRLSVIESAFAPLPFDAAVARAYGRLAAAVAAAGRQPRARVMDLVIAATAVAHGATLVTADLDDLRGLEELVDAVGLHDGQERDRH